MTIEIYIIPQNRLQISSDVLTHIWCSVVKEYMLGKGLETSNPSLKDLGGEEFYFEKIPKNKFIVFATSSSNFVLLNKSDNIDDIDNEYLFLEDYWLESKNILTDVSERWKEVGKYFVLESLHRQNILITRITALISIEIAKLTNGFILVESDNISCLEPGLYSWQKATELLA
jgi:hypothetical protein